MHRDLLKLRREVPAFSAQRRGGVDGAVLADEAFVLRFFGGGGVDDPNPLDDRLLVVNLGMDLVLNPAPEPLLAPPVGKEWAILWSSEDPRYGGLGTPALETTENWLIPGHAAIVLYPIRRAEWWKNHCRIRTPVNRMKKRNRLKPEPTAKRLFGGYLIFNMRYEILNMGMRFSLLE